MTPDVNVLVAASRADHPHHRVSMDWLRAALKACKTGGRLLILPMVAASVIRLVTNPRIFVAPTPVADALAFIDTLLQVPGVEMPAIGPEWPRFAELCRSGSLSANAVPDAWIAAAVAALGGPLVTFDRDFQRLLDRRQLLLLQPSA